MKKIILMAMLLIIGIGSGYAQRFTKATTQIDVNGLIIDEQYTDAQMRSALGPPTEFIRHVDEMGEQRTYWYEGNSRKSEFFIHHTGQGGFIEFAIKTPRFTLFDGRLKVGDHISRVTELKLGKLELKSKGVYYLYLIDWSDAIIITTNADDSKIRSFYFSSGL